MIRWFRFGLNNWIQTRTWLEHQINIDPSRAESADVWLKPAANPQPTKTKVVSANSKGKQSGHDQADDELPEVFVPFDIRLTELKLKQGRYHQQTFDTGLMDICCKPGLMGHCFLYKKCGYSRKNAVLNCQSR